MRPRDIASAWVKHRPWHWSRDRDSPPRAGAKRAQIDEQWTRKCCPECDLSEGHDGEHLFFGGSGSLGGDS